jgi:pyridoxamine 5'-phosphate oxidase
MNDENVDPNEQVLHKEDLDPNPFSQFRNWYERALSVIKVDPSAMTLATASKDGAPSARMVLLKGYDEQGFVFFTNYESRKSRELEENPQAALVFYWRGLNRQIRITGTVNRTTQKESEEYFRTRSRDSRLGAWASQQSEVIENREALDRAFHEMEEKYPGDEIPLPPFWGGFRVTPHTFEFWEGRTGRLHDRFRYTRGSDGNWIIERLSP